MRAAFASAPPVRIAVVGGGFAGLAAAQRLAAAGVRVSLFEKSAHPGGLAMTFSFGGTEIEKYYHHWFTSDEDILDVIRELGLGDRVWWGSPVMGLFCAGRIHRFTSPADLLRFRPFSARAKARFALVTLFLQRCSRRELFEDVTADAWLRRWAGREVYETVWGPLLRAKFGRHAESISMAWIWSKMRLRGRSRKGGGTRELLGYVRGGFGVVAKALVEDIRRRGGDVHLGERVESIRTVGEGRDRFGIATPRRRETFTSVISTVAPPLLAALAPDLAAEDARRLGAVEHSAILCTLLVLRRRFSPIYWMNVSDRTIPFGGLIEHTNYVPAETYGGRHLMYVSHYVYPDDEIYSLDAAGVYARYRPALARIQPAFADDWVEARRTFRDRWAQPIVTADYHRRLLPLAGPLPGLYLATMAQVYPEDRGTNYAVRIGRAAADRALEDLPRDGEMGRERRLASGP
ncbi:MAG: hypothetical protein QOD06_1080 [Candidatus Binatota bacterium]|nr:hypothetical protein [Candidatus Binatota bacterium]